MKLFTVGPVEMYPETLKIEGSQLPYFRTEEFGAVMKECETYFLQSVHAAKDASFIALTCSGTGAMDAAVMNLLGEKDRVLVIDGGSFGHRFVQICRRYGIQTDSFEIGFGEAFSKERFEDFAAKGCGYTALLVNVCETGTGQRYDLDYLGQFCRRREMLLIVDAVSAYLADPIDMEGQGIDCLFTASQKALALSPGAAFAALSPRAAARAAGAKAAYYFDFHEYLENQKRGQPPFTCAVGIMLALHQRLESILKAGTANVIELHGERAAYFRAKLRGLPVRIPDIPLSNCCTPVLFPEHNAGEIYEALREKDGIYLTPSGGALKTEQLRVGHMGNLSRADFDQVICALERELLK